MTLRQMKPARLAELREHVASGSTGFVSFALIRDLLADRDWHRKRVRVTTDDIRRAGVTWEHMQAWLKKTGNRIGACIEERPAWADVDEAEGGEAMRRYIQSTIHLAFVSRHADSELDVLAAMRDALK